MIKHTSLPTILLVIGLAASGCANKHEAEKTGEKPAAVIKGVILETVNSEAVPEMLDVVGTVRARTSAVVSTRIPGIVSMLKVREGDRVRKGQVLIQLDAQENQYAAAAATAGIAEAHRGLDEALARKKLADSTFERFSNLYNEQAISRQEFEVKQSERELAVQGAARAEARLKQAQEGAKAAITVADYTRIAAPIPGVITSRQADPGATVFPAQPLLTIEEEGDYQLELVIPESMVARVKPGTPVQVSLDALKVTFAATISQIVPSADPASRTFIAKISLSQKNLKSGMFGRGSILLGSAANGMMVQKKAVVERGAMTFVWIVEKDSIARMRLVKVGKALGERVEILAGLSDGERLIVSGVDKVSEGSKVE
jgi:RND family efflux transporter MFP subunit